MQTVTVLLTKYPGLMSGFSYQIGGNGFSHVSLALSGDETVYYSFNYHGFCIETLEKHRSRGATAGLSFQLHISDTAYEKIKIRIQQFKTYKHQYRYTKLGVALCILGIPFKWKRHYFCSQFVAELLADSESVKLKRQPSLYLPHQLFKEVSANGELTEFKLNRAAINNSETKFKQTLNKQLVC